MMEEIGTYDLLSSVVPIIIVIVATGWFLYSKGKCKKSIVKACKVISEPSVSVLSVRWNDQNITFVILFEDDRLLFIRPDKIENYSKTQTHEDLLKTDKLNFVIPHSEISKIELKRSSFGVNAGRSGKIVIHSSKKQPFDILEQESFEKCEEIFHKYLSNKLDIC